MSTRMHILHPSITITALNAGYIHHHAPTSIIPILLMIACIAIMLWKFPQKRRIKIKGGHQMFAIIERCPQNTCKKQAVTIWTMHRRPLKNQYRHT